MILDTENIPALRNTTAQWATPTPSHLDHRIAQLELTVAAQARELHELRLALRGIMAALQRFDGDGK